MINFIARLFAPTEKLDFDDPDIFNLCDAVEKLQERVEVLESENIELTNTLYEIENRLQSQIDNIHPVTYNLQDYTLDK